MKYCFIKHGDVVHEWPAWKSGQKGTFPDSLVPNVQEFEEIVGDQSMLVLSNGNEDRELVDGNYHFVTIKGTGHRGLMYWIGYARNLWKVWKRLGTYKPDVSVFLSADLRLCVAALYHTLYGGKLLPTLAVIPVAPGARGTDKLISRLVLRTLASPGIPVILSIGPAPGRQVRQKIAEPKEIWEYWPSFPRKEVNFRQKVEFAKDERFRVFFVGRLTEDKGIFEFLEMAELLREEIPSLHMVVIGDGPARTEAEQRCRKLGLGQVVTFLGHKPARMLFSYFATGQILVVPTRASFPEGCCRASMEGILGRVVPVASSVGGLVDNIEDGKTGYLVPPDRPDMFVDRILTLYHDPELRNLMRRNAEEKREFLLNPPDTLVTCVRRFTDEFCQCK